MKTIKQVFGCARCGEDHVNLEVRKFERPIAPAELDFQWQYWATCPTNGDPILITVIDEE